MTYCMVLSLVIILGMSSGGCSKVFWVGPEFTNTDRDRLTMEKFRLELRYANEAMTKFEYQRRMAPVMTDLNQFYKEKHEREEYNWYVQFINGFYQGVSKYFSLQSIQCEPDPTRTYNRVQPLTCY